MPSTIESRLLLGLPTHIPSGAAARGHGKSFSRRQTALGIEQWQLLLARRDVDEGSSAPSTRDGSTGSYPSESNIGDRTPTRQYT